MDKCILTQIGIVDDTMTIGEVRQLCAAERQLDLAEPINEKAADEVANVAAEPQNIEVTLEENTIATEDGSAVSRRVLLEKTQARNPFALMPHKPNYIIFANNLSSTHETPFEQDDPNRDYNFQPWETKFQISLKMPLVRGLFNQRADLFVAYTNRSFWQQFNKDGSAPFRDSNHEPEAWLSFGNDFELFGWKNSVIRTGISHQSNGQSGALSRSWNRAYADFIFERGDWYLSFKPWLRIAESADNDDNPDIDEYMGNFELGAYYKLEDHSFEMILRNNLDFGENYGAIQLGWTFPLTDRLQGYVQWFNGYGESLIDYNAHTNSIGFGIKVSDWL
ncbi:phospholipase A [Methylophaga frappieri]|nr:phospholipase A [Methylophaga frappieri]